MDCLTDDLCAIVLARLPLKTSTASKVVCKQWKSIVESPFFRQLFISLHQNSHSCSWSLMYFGTEIMAHYRCETWGLEKSLDFYISSFLKRFKNNEEHYKPAAEVVAYSDVGLVLIHVKPLKEKIHGSLYVANPVSRECVEILYPDALPLGFHETKQDHRMTGIVTRTDDKGVVVSSWSLNTYHLPYSLYLGDHRSAISLINGNLHLLAWKSLLGGGVRVVVSIDFYAGSDRCRVTPFPDSDKTPEFQRACTASQGFLMHMNIVVSEDKLCLWRLQSDGWQLISAIPPVALVSTGFDRPLTINPFDEKTAYFCGKHQKGLLSVNFHNGKFVLHNQLEHSSDDSRIMVSLKVWGYTRHIKQSERSSFVLPQWLHRIPNTVTRV
ncbi:unnamed protein product [Microthlaspi erraticum]|uniref:F-box domain-containing protein n=1 Tax=Microthlaspi erraticum TaxID=1685480 RepID=A0A6D2JZ09_9BRAS|nr:unnamed protein product [Microthlaspi erraticum]